MYIFLPSFHRAMFIKSSMEMMDKFGFDGLDLDYEFPDSDDRYGFAAWVRELKDSFSPSGYELTAAVSASESKMRWITDLFYLLIKLD